jgi:hypothetical protein
MIAALDDAQFEMCWLNKRLIYKYWCMTQIHVSEIYSFY